MAPEDKPKGWPERAAWQKEAVRLGKKPICGIGVCTNECDPAWKNSDTPLLYCQGCAFEINAYGPARCMRLTEFELKNWAGVKG